MGGWVDGWMRDLCDGVDGWAGGWVVELVGGWGGGVGLGGLFGGVGVEMRRRGWLGVRRGDGFWGGGRRRLLI